MDMNSTNGNFNEAALNLTADEAALIPSEAETAALLGTERLPKDKLAPSAGEKANWRSPAGRQAYDLKHGSARSASEFAHK